MVQAVPQIALVMLGGRGAWAIADACQPLRKRPEEVRSFGQDIRRRNESPGISFDACHPKQKPSGGCLSPLAATAVVICLRRHME